VKVLEKKVIVAHGPNRAPLCGFITYIDPKETVLLRRIGWEVSNDIHDDFADAVSPDNGKTWGDPRPALRSTPVKGGAIVHTENAVLYLPDRNLLVHWTNDQFQPSLTAGVDSNYSYQIRITAGEPEAFLKGKTPKPFISDYGIKQGPCVSFATPMQDSRGRLLLPVQWQKREDPKHPIVLPEPPSPLPELPKEEIQLGPMNGRAFPKRKDMPDVFLNYVESGLLIGEFQSGNRFKWHISRTVPCEFGRSSRGMMEPTVAELPGQRLIMVVRGSNADWPEKTGYKWLTHSQDGGETWSEAVPLTFDDGEPVESSSTGSALFRSLKGGKLYWIGNLCLEGRRAYGNMPRSPLYIVEVQEDPPSPRLRGTSPVALKRGTATAIDRTQPGEHPNTQHSNFKFYQDRVTGEVVVFFTRYGERGYENDRWIQADLYQYRVEL
jgi:hypothetical protein